MTLPKFATDAGVRRARALADPTRRALLDNLRWTPLDVRALAVRIELHENAVRQHLRVLRSAGLVIEEVDRSAQRAGRPRRLYRAAEDSPRSSPFERLAALLADVAAGHDPAEVGTVEGAALADAVPAGDSAEVIARVASAQGFAVHVDRRPDGTHLLLDECPFASIAGPVVCTLHHGIVEGAARASGAAVVGFDIADPAVHPCELTLARTTGDPS